MSWDGEERRDDFIADRRLQEEDRRKIQEAQEKIQAVHEVLIKVDLNFDNFLKRFDEHVRLEEKRYVDHQTDDEEHFDRIYPMISDLRRFMYTSVGIGLGLGAVTTIISVIVFIKGH